MITKPHGPCWMKRLAAVILTVAYAGQTMAATLYVDGGNPAARDGNKGTQSAPWKTLQHAADSAQAGDVVLVAPGRYNELVTVAQSGTVGSRLTLRAEPSRKARVKGFLVKGDYIAIEGFEITNDAPGTNGIFAGEVNNKKDARTGCRFVDNFIHDINGTAITGGLKAEVRNNLMQRVLRGIFVNSGAMVENNEIDTLVSPMVEQNGKKRPGKTQYAFYAGDDITFRGNYFHGNPVELLLNWGVDFFVTWDVWTLGSSHRILIENNRCFNATHGSEAEAIVHHESSDITFRNNLFVNTVYVGVLCKGWSHITVENNTFINCGAYPIWFQTERMVEGSIVRNNLIAYWKRDRLVALGWPPAESGVMNWAVRTNPAATIDCDYNMMWDCKNRGYGAHDVVAEPQFVDPENGDFRLKPGSPGIGAGTPLEAIKTDLVGTPRPNGKACTAGALEYKPTQGKTGDRE